MTIAFGASVRGADFTSTNSLTFTGPTVSGSNTLGIVQIGCQSGTGTTVSTITWGGSSMTKLSSTNKTISGSFCEIWYIVNPSSAASIVVTCSGNWTGIFAGASYYTGVNQSNPINQSSGSTAASATSITVTPSFMNTNGVLVSTVINGAACATPTANNDTQDQVGCNGNISWCSGYSGSKSIGSYSDNYSIGSAVAWAIGYALLNPADEVVLIQSANYESASSAATSRTLAYTSNNTSGNTLLCWVSFDGTGTTTQSVVTDSAGNSWTKLTNNTSKHSGNICELWYISSCAAGANTITATFKTAGNVNNNTAWVALHIVELSGTYTSSPIDTNSSPTSTGSTGTSPQATASASLTASVAGDWYGFFVQKYNGGQTQTYTNGVELQRDTSLNETVSMYNIFTSTGSQTLTATFGTNDNWDAIIVAVKNNAGGGGGSTGKSRGYVLG